MKRNPLIVLSMLAVLISYIGISGIGRRDAEKLEAKVFALQKEIKRLDYLYSLGVEFGMNILVIELVDYYARDALKEKAPHHRLVATPEFYTYIMLSLIHTESRGDYLALGDGGKAVGLTQIWLTTARQYQKDITQGNLLDIDTNLRISFKHFEELLKRFDGNVLLALLAWNRGENVVKRSLAVGDSPKNGYLRKIVHTALQSNASRNYGPP